jgi:hypothetical protein
MDPPPLESGYRLVVAVEALANPEEDNGWTVLTTTVSAESCADAELLQTYQDQNTTVEPGFRWIKNPAAIAPVCLEKPERIAALALMTVLGLLVYSVIQRQVRLYLRTHDQQLPGNKGLTAIPTAAVVLALFAQIAVVQLWLDEQEVAQLSGVQSHHLLVCDALGLDSSWRYTVPSAQKNGRDIQTPRTWAGAACSTAERGAVRLELVLDRRRRMGEDSASGVPWGEGLGKGDCGRLRGERQEAERSAYRL